MYIKHKRSYGAIGVILIAMLFMGVDKKMSRTEIELYKEPISVVEKEIIEEDEESIYVSERLGLYAEGELEVYMDQVEILFEKFDFPYQLRDYFRQICELQNVSITDAMGIGQIESWSGNHEDYKNRTEERAYYIKGEKCWDDGFFQLTSYSKYREEQGERFYNPELIASLGYVRGEEFDANDDVSNIQVGVAFYGYLYRRFGDYETASLAYNAGPGRVINGTVPAITYQYAKAVKNRWKTRQGDV